MNKQKKRSQKMVTCYSLHSEHYGTGPLFLTKKAAQLDKMHLLEKCPDDKIKICKTQIAKRDYELLKEHPGY